MSKKFALFSVCNKSGLVDIARKVTETHAIIASSGTAAVLREAKLDVIEVSDYIDYPELFNGRVKTLHPKIHGGIAFKDDPESTKMLEDMEIGEIDLVVCNLNDFGEIAMGNSRGRENLDLIDIGGPALIRAAAKNFDRVTVIVEPNDYANIIPKLPDIEISVRIQLAAKAFNLIANYDIEISKYMNKIADISTSFFDKSLGTTYFLNGKLAYKLKYGENPHQSASYYNSEEIPFFDHIAGPNLSYNTILDMNVGWDLVSEFQTPTCAIIKHRTPSGVVSANDIVTAYEQAHVIDESSTHGGVHVFNRGINRETASQLVKTFVTAVFAPDYEPGVVEILQQKENLTIVVRTKSPESTQEIKILPGGFVIQEKDKTKLELSQLEFTEKPGNDELEALEFAWTVVKHARSNAIAIVKGTQTMGIASGLTSRAAAVKLAIEMASDQVEHGILASDGFFASTDSIQLAAKSGIKMIITPKGSISDEDMVKEAQRLGITLLLTNRRAFKH
ncbi:MAG: bifunctional phosphoribosylaminoimidazolecarboxamide formyltransferase/IMP cyclohydrolase [Candidatus Kariarchaeaceae archaeon]|jgi:phosphoribosylaminoimidazolecarboxamide formyltransferase/IMP cyclohydrolase